MGCHPPTIQNIFQNTIVAVVVTGRSRQLQDIQEPTTWLVEIEINRLIKELTAITFWRD